MEQSAIGDAAGGEADLLAPRKFARGVDAVGIADSDFSTRELQPQAAEETVRFGASQTKVEMQFQEYRKYESNSTVSYDADGK